MKTAKTIITLAVIGAAAVIAGKATQAGMRKF